MKGVLLVNTGSPGSDKRKDVRTFIEDMLLDPKLIGVPDWFRPLLVKGIIGPFRQYSSSRHYSLIWDKEHNKSPLLYNMEELARKLEKRSGMPVEIAMRYGQPSVTEALDRFCERNLPLHEVVVVPLFPQYAESSYKTAVDEVGRCFYNKPHPFRLKITEPYFNHPAYIGALKTSIEPYTGQEYDRIVFCFHSLPISHIDEGWHKGREFDYVYQLKETVRLVAKSLNIPANKYRITYSSAIGRKWLKPDILETLRLMAQEGQQRVIVVMPGFACDNLETLFDINIRAREEFIKHGGKSLFYARCLNSESYWVDALMSIIQ